MKSGFFAWLIGLTLGLAGCGASGPRTDAPRATDAVGSRPTEQVVRPTSAATPFAPTTAPPAAQPTAVPPVVPPTAGPTSQPSQAERTLELTQPVGGAAISSPAAVRGRVSISPFEATLRGRVYDSQGSVIGEGPVMVAAEPGQPGEFAGAIPFQGRPAVVEVAELSARDGSVIISARVQVAPAPAELPAPAGRCAGVQGLELPAAGALTGLPLHVLAAIGQPGEQIEAVVRWENGVELVHRLPVLSGPGGCGVVVANVNWQTESVPPQPLERAATLVLRDSRGTTLAQRDLQIMRWDDPATVEIPLTWLIDEQLQRSQRRVPQTPQVGTVALEELLWGPDPANLAGFTTALPTPEEVLSYQGRGADWGPRVRLLKLTIENGVATANFSREILAFGGGSTRLQLLVSQVEMTLSRFPTVSEVRLQVEGQDASAVLQP